MLEIRRQSGGREEGRKDLQVERLDRQKRGRTTLPAGEGLASGALGSCRLSSRTAGPTHLSLTPSSLIVQLSSIAIPTPPLTAGPA